MRYAAKGFCQLHAVTEAGRSRLGQLRKPAMPPRTPAWVLGLRASAPVARADRVVQSRLRPGIAVV